MEHEHLAPPSLQFLRSETRRSRPPREGDAGLPASIRFTRQFNVALLLSAYRLYLVKVTHTVKVHFKLTDSCCRMWWRTS